MRTQIHMCANIAGLLKRPDRELDGLFTCEEGYEVNAKGARQYLCKQLALGHRVIAMGKCDNFDPQEGCLGHPVPDMEMKDTTFERAVCRSLSAPTVEN